MKSITINELSYTYALWEKHTINFGRRFNVIYSEANGSGKTTLLRILLYTMGFKVLPTKGIDFDLLTFRLSVTNYNGDALSIEKRECGPSALFIVILDGTEREFAQDEKDIIYRKYIFGIDSQTVCNNLLGAFYFDQEFGWDLLNRGRVHGSIRFSVDELLCGLSGAEVKDVKEEIAKKKKLLSDYEKLREVVTLAQMPISSDGMPEDEHSESVNAKRSQLKLIGSQIAYYKSQLRTYERIYNDNKDDVNFISKLNLHISHNGETIRVTSKNIKDFSLIQESIDVKVKKLRKMISSLQFQSDRVKSELDRFDTPESLIVKYLSRLKEINLGTLDLDAAIITLRNSISTLRSKITSIASSTEYDLLNKRIIDFLNILKLRVPYDNSDRLLLRRLHGDFTGAEFYKHIIAYKLAYISAIHDKFAINLPIIIDSPYAREIDEFNFQNVMKILNDYFPHSQIIIASIRDNIRYPHKRITLADGVLEYPIKQDLIK